MKIKLEIEIDIENGKSCLGSERVDNYDELAAVYKSQARKDIEGFISGWSVPVTCTNVTVKE